MSELTGYSDEELLMELINRNETLPAPVKKQFHTKHSEVVIGIGKDDVAYIQLDNDSLQILENITSETLNPK